MTKRAEPNLTVLAEITGLVDGLFAPGRRELDRHDWRDGRDRGQARQKYKTFGVPWQVGGDEANRKRGQRELLRLEDAGLVLRCANWTRRTGVALTATGYVVGRAVSGMPGIGVALDRLADIAGNPEPSVPEIVLVGGCVENLEDPKWLPLCLLVSRELQPALSMRWAFSTTGRGGRVSQPVHVSYSITDAGKAALQEGPEPYSVGKLPEAIAECRETYAAAYADSFCQTNGYRESEG